MSETIELKVSIEQELVLTKMFARIHQVIKAVDDLKVAVSELAEFGEPSSSVIPGAIPVYFPNKLDFEEKARLTAAVARANEEK